MNYGNLLYLYDIFRYDDSVVRGSVGRGIGSRVCSYVNVEVESRGDREFWIEVGGAVGSRDIRSVGKHVKVEVNVRIDDSVGWDFYRGVSYGVWGYCDSEVNMSKVYLLWRFMVVYIEFFTKLLVLVLAVHM